MHSAAEGFELPCTFCAAATLHVASIDVKCCTFFCCCVVMYVLQADPALTAYSRDLITNAAKQLHAAKMAVFDERSGNLFVTELGRVASHFYIRCRGHSQV